ncbi:class I SAM-dependent methyltransferase [Luteibacter sp. UNCMF366Tsu5.1]|uniref:class I SAM-dependent methyltransferase n=1 Tax=Luteibacter sp. UNCMF366Tsu5.1 TaxID=1502758 RepID=UPI0009088C5E|nr:class I SAM-dependent methyltransferase [Luteibacter sp. UNCMF366Tsu5.1]SFW34811.1 Methyltransferase domain-containing protein [Luteibacter sp. UNCMF366Tsu5.1]
MTDLRSTERFSDRVEDYVRYRPDYPRALVDWLYGLGVHADWSVADIGAGTGISSKLFLDAGHRVTGVEPNTAMREAAERWLAADARFHAVNGSAEGTGLPEGSVDLVIAGQAFHWFDTEKVRAEFARVLSPRGLVAVFWNTRRLVGTPFLEGYERLLHEYGVDYVGVAERYADDDSMARWFGRGYRGMASFPHGQKLDEEALRGRLMSSSYAPKPGHPNHEPMLRALHALFEATQDGGTIDFDYDTRVFAGRPEHA